MVKKTGGALIRVQQLESSDLTDAHERPPESASATRFRRKKAIDRLKKNHIRLAAGAGFVVGYGLAALFDAPTPWLILIAVGSAGMAYHGCEGVHEQRLGRHDDATLEKLILAQAHERSTPILIGWVVVALAFVLVAMKQ